MTTPSRLPRAALGAGALLAIGAASALGWLPLAVAGGYLVASLVAGPLS